MSASRSNPGHGRQVLHPGHAHPVDLIREKLGEGMSVDELLEAYPGLTTEDDRAAEAWARADAPAVPKELMDAVVAHFDPVRVILFGSQGPRRGERGQRHRPPGGALARWRNRRRA